MKLKNIQILAEGKWISLKKATYFSNEGKELNWEFVSRQKDQKVVTIICKSIETSHSRKSKQIQLAKFLFISQPRVPFNKVVIGFPAGLIEEGETPEEAAIRELKEETGYTGKIVTISSDIAKSAGLTNETTKLVECNVKDNPIEFIKSEDEEEINSFWMNPEEFIEMANKLDPDKYIIEADALFFIKGYLSR